MNKILVISPHPDDESIGCGGTIRKHIIDGDRVEVIFLTSGEKGGHGMPENETRTIREEEANKAAAILQIDKLDFWHEPDGAFRASEINVNRLIEKIISYLPNIIYAPHENEQHTDHREAAMLISLAIKQLPSGFEKPMVWLYEVWTPIQRMDHIVDISMFVDSKRQAILAYQSQCSVLAFDDAILGLNRYRGEMFSWPEGEYAEVFKKVTT
jgi:LmbE family N-acetylglucosaminyl deacetylase